MPGAFYKHYVPTARFCPHSPELLLLRQRLDDLYLVRRREPKSFTSLEPRGTRMPETLDLFPSPLEIQHPDVRFIIPARVIQATVIARKRIMAELRRRFEGHDLLPLSRNPIEQEQALPLVENDPPVVVQPNWKRSKVSPVALVPLLFEVVDNNCTPIIQRQPPHQPLIIR